MKLSLSFKDYIHNQLYPLLVRLGLLLLLYSFFRFLFFRANAGSFPNAPFSLFFYGVRFDLSALFFSNFPYIMAVLLPFTFCYKKIYRKICDSYFIIVNCFAAMVSYIDTAYFPYVLKRMTCDFFAYLQIGFDFQRLLPSFFKQFWYLFLLFGVTVFVIVYVVKVSNRIITKTPVFLPLLQKDLLYKTTVFLASVFMAILCMRGGWQTRPLGLIDSGRYASVQNAALVANTPFTLIKSFGQEYKIERDYFTDLAEAERYYTPVINTINPCTNYCYPVKNVVIIILEGFSQYLISGMEGEQGYCPFLDSLLHQSVSFNGIANGHRTIEALPAIFSGLPKLLDKSAAETQFSNNFTSSPVEVLKKQGYHTLFFHGAKNGSMNIESYCYSIGFDTYYGKNEYPDPSDYDGVWGISDRSFLQFVAQKLNSAPQPFFAGVLTLSSHNPFVIPQDAAGINLKTGTHPMQTLASYTDYAVKEFFKTVSQSDWYPNTLFVFTGDHTGEGAIPKSGSLYQTFQIPLFFYHPMANTNQHFGAMQQLDIMPTLFSYLNINEPLFSYGNNIFDSTYTSYCANYAWGVYQLMSHDFMLQFDGEKSIGLYDVRNDILMTTNLLQDSTEIAALYEQKLKAMLQSYTTRLVKNKLFINNE
jgi:phosphoglycerol transferase MdoB-like AlkP superfamily enzyme